MTMTMRAVMLAAVLMLGGPAHADDIRDAIGEAQRAYSAGDLAGTRAALDVATQLLAQKSAEGLGRFLPAPLAGWRAGAIATDASAAAIFGGGLIAKRSYTRGSEEVTVQVVASSPILMQMAPIFGNAQMLGAMGRVFRVKGKTAVVTREGDVQMVLGKALVKIEGSAPEAAKRSYLEALDFAGIEAFGS